ncbi:phage virion morphogenesis protein [Leptospira sp. 96542]|nr:phage virion morphogenesis protein [Leptospira sp. 96542]
MSDSFEELADWAAPLLAVLEPPARRQLMRRIAAALANNQSRRIARQQNPDGTPYEPRKKSQQGQIRERLAQGRGRIRRAMFTKLRTRSHLKTKGDAVQAAVGFMSRAARIARIHQFGLMDSPAPGVREVRYAQRELLGFTEADRAMVRDFILDALGRGT